MIKIAIDAMGGDFGVTTTVPAAMEAVKKYKDIEIMIDYSKGRVVKLGDLTPEWWIDYK